MKTVEEIIKERVNTKSKIKTERQFIVSEFVDEINKERLGTKYRQVGGREVAVKLSHLKSNRDLYDFLKHSYNSFHRYQQNKLFHL